MKTYNRIINVIEEKGAAYFILIDPDKISEDKLPAFVQYCSENGVDGFLIGGSLVISGVFQKFIETIKANCELPVIIFPGEISQIYPSADALLYISLISGRNGDQLIGKHVLAAPIIKKYDIEPISTGYMLIESGRITTAEYISGTKPIPRNKPEIAAATALAAEYLGMKLIYLEAGSGADNAVPDEMIRMVSEYCKIPVIAGGGIRDSATARRKVEAGAKIIVTGNYFENENNWKMIKNFADAVHVKLPVEL